MWQEGADCSDVDVPLGAYGSQSPEDSGDPFLPAGQLEAVSTLQTVGQRYCHANAPPFRVVRRLDPCA
jgi:hypothetical protein